MLPLRLLLRGATRVPEPRVAALSLSTSSAVRDKPAESAPSTNPFKPEDSVLGKRMHRVSDMDKRMLVWMKKFPSMAEVPDKVSEESMHQTRNWVRIRVSNIMIVGTLLGCAFAVYTGKKRAESGDTILRQNLEWHKSMNAEPSRTTSTS